MGLHTCGSVKQWDTMKTTYLFNQSRALYPIILWVNSMQGIQSSLRELQPNIFRYCSIISIRVIVTVRKLFVTVSSRVTTGDCARLIPLSPLHVHPSTHRLHTCTVCECMMFELTELSDDCRAGVYSLTPSSSGEWAPPPHLWSCRQSHFYSCSFLVLTGGAHHAEQDRSCNSHKGHTFFDMGNVPRFCVFKIEPMFSLRFKY